MVHSPNVVACGFIAGSNFGNNHHQSLLQSVNSVKTGNLPESANKTGRETN